MHGFFASGGDLVLSYVLENNQRDDVCFFVRRSECGAEPVTADQYNEEKLSPVKPVFDGVPDMRRNSYCFCTST